MEILNNLWLAVSTPNETLIDVILIIGIFIENSLVLGLFTTILNISPKTFQKIIYIVIMSIIGVLTMYIIPSPFNIFVNLFIPILVAYLIFKISILKIFASIIIALIILNLLGSLLLNPYLSILNLNTEELNHIPLYRFLYMCTIYIFTIIINLILKVKNIKVTILEDIDNKNKVMILLNLLSGILAIIIQSIILFYYIDKLPVFITFLSFISLLAYFAISIYSLTRIFKLILTTRKLESAEAYNNTLHILHDNVRGFKHDFDNIVTTIGGYIKTNDMNGLKKYYEQLEDDCQRVNNLYLLNPEIINNNGIYNLLTKKSHNAEEKDIKVNITFLLDLSTLHMKIYEFARILGILLDNAIEASSESEEKIINLTFRNDIKNSRELIIVENTYQDKNIDTEKIFEKGISGKENHTGLGLWEVRKLIKKNNNINLYTAKNDKFFSQQLEIYY